MGTRRTPRGPDPPPGPRWVTSGEAARRTRLPKRLIQRAVHAGRLRGGRDGQGRIVVDEADLEQWAHIRQGVWPITDKPGPRPAPPTEGVDHGTEDEQDEQGEQEG